MNLPARILQMVRMESRHFRPRLSESHNLRGSAYFELGLHSRRACHTVGEQIGRFPEKSSWFFFPLGYLFRAIGGVPVERGNKHVSLVDSLIKRFNSLPRLVLAITPEGTRKRTTRWHTGFLRIAYETGVPICLGAIDFPTRRIYVTEVFEPTGNIDADLRAVKKFLPSLYRYISRKIHDR